MDWYHAQKPRVYVFSWIYKKPLEISKYFNTTDFKILKEILKVEMVKPRRRKRGRKRDRERELKREMYHLLGW